MPNYKVGSDQKKDRRSLLAKAGGASMVFGLGGLATLGIAASLRQKRTIDLIDEHEVNKGIFNARQRALRRGGSDTANTLDLMQPTRFDAVENDRLGRLFAPNTAERLLRKNLENLSIVEGDHFFKAFISNQGMSYSVPNYGSALDKVLRTKQRDIQKSFIDLMKFGHVKGAADKSKNATVKTRTVGNKNIDIFQTFFDDFEYQFSRISEELTGSGVDLSEFGAIEELKKIVEDVQKAALVEDSGVKFNERGNLTFDKRMFKEISNRTNQAIKSLVDEMKNNIEGRSLTYGNVEGETYSQLTERLTQTRDALDNQFQNMQKAYTDGEISFNEFTSAGKVYFEEKNRLESEFKTIDRQLRNIAKDSRAIHVEHNANLVKSILDGSYQPLERGPISPPDFTSDGTAEIIQQHVNEQRKQRKNKHVMLLSTEAKANMGATIAENDLRSLVKQSVELLPDEIRAFIHHKEGGLFKGTQEELLQKHIKSNTFGGVYSITDHLVAITKSIVQQTEEQIAGRQGKRIQLGALAQTGSIVFDLNIDGAYVPIQFDISGGGLRYSGGYVQTAVARQKISKKYPDTVSVTSYMGRQEEGIVRQMPDIIGLLLDKDQKGNVPLANRRMQILNRNLNALSEIDEKYAPGKRGTVLDNTIHLTRARAKTVQATSDRLEVAKQVLNNMRKMPNVTPEQLAAQQYHIDRLKEKLGSQQHLPGGTKLPKGIKQSNKLFSSQVYDVLDFQNAQLIVDGKPLDAVSNINPYTSSKPKGTKGVFSHLAPEDYFLSINNLLAKKLDFQAYFAPMQHQYGYGFMQRAVAQGLAYGHRDNVGLINNIIAEKQMFPMLSETMLQQQSDMPAAAAGRQGVTYYAMNEMSPLYRSTEGGLGIMPKSIQEEMVATHKNIIKLDKAGIQIRNDGVGQMLLNSASGEKGKMPNDAKTVVIKAEDLKKDFAIDYSSGKKKSVSLLQLLGANVFEGQDVELKYVPLENQMGYLEVTGFAKMTDFEKGFGKTISQFTSDSHYLDIVQDHFFARKLPTGQQGTDLGRLGRNLHVSIGLAEQFGGILGDSTFAQQMMLNLRKGVGIDKLTIDKSIGGGNYGQVVGGVISKTASDLKAQLIRQEKMKPGSIINPRTGKMHAGVARRFEKTINKMTQRMLGADQYFDFFKVDPGFGSFARTGVSIADMQNVQLVVREQHLSQFIHYAEHNTGDTIFSATWLIQNQNAFNADLDELHEFGVKQWNPILDTTSNVRGIYQKRDDMTNAMKALAIEKDNLAQAKTPERKQAILGAIQTIEAHISKVKEDILEMTRNQYTSGFAHIASDGKTPTLAGIASREFQAYGAQLPKAGMGGFGPRDIGPGGVPGGVAYDIWKRLSLREGGMYGFDREVELYQRLGLTETETAMKNLEPFFSGKRKTRLTDAEFRAGNIVRLSAFRSMKEKRAALNTKIGDFRVVSALDMGGNPTNVLPEGTMINISSRGYVTSDANIEGVDISTFDRAGLLTEEEFKEFKKLASGKTIALEEGETASLKLHKNTMMDQQGVDRYGSVTYHKIHVKKFGEFVNDGATELIQMTQDLTNMGGANGAKPQAVKYYYLNDQLRALWRYIKSSMQGEDVATRSEKFQRFINTQRDTVLGGKKSDLAKRILSTRVVGFKGVAATGGVHLADIENANRKANKNPALDNTHVKGANGMLKWRDSNGKIHYTTPRAGETWIADKTFIEVQKEILMMKHGNLSEKQAMTQAMEIANDIKSGKKIMYGSAHRESVMTSQQLGGSRIRLYEAQYSTAEQALLEEKAGRVAHYKNMIDHYTFIGDVDADISYIMMSLLDEDKTTAEAMKSSYENLKIVSHTTQVDGMDGVIDYAMSGESVRMLKKLPSASAFYTLDNLKSEIMVINGEQHFNTVTGATLKNYLSYQDRKVIEGKTYAHTAFKSKIKQITSSMTKDGSDIYTAAIQMLENRQFQNDHELFLKGRITRDELAARVRKRLGLDKNMSNVLDTITNKALKTDKISRDKILDTLTSSMTETSQDLRELRDGWINKVFDLRNESELSEQLVKLRGERIVVTQKIAALMGRESISDEAAKSLQLDMVARKKAAGEDAIAREMATTTYGLQQNFFNEKTMTPKAWKDSHIIWLDTYQLYGESTISVDKRTRNSYRHYLSDVQQNSMSSKHTIPLYLTSWSDTMNALRMDGNIGEKRRFEVNRNTVNESMNRVNKMMQAGDNLVSVRDKIIKSGNAVDKAMYSFISGDYAMAKPTDDHVKVWKEAFGLDDKWEGDQIYLSEVIAINEAKLRQEGLSKKDITTAKAKIKLASNAMDQSRITADGSTFASREAALGRKGSSIISSPEYLKMITAIDNINLAQRFIHIRRELTAGGHTRTGGEILYQAIHSTQQEGSLAAGVSAEEIALIKNLPGGNILTSMLESIGIDMGAKTDQVIDDIRQMSAITDVTPNRQYLTQRGFAREVSQRITSEASSKFGNRFKSGLQMFGTKVFDDASDPDNHRMGGVGLFGAGLAILGGYLFTQAVKGPPAGELGQSAGRGGEYWEHAKRKVNENKFDPSTAQMKADSKRRGVINRILQNNILSAKAYVQPNRMPSPHGTMNQIMSRNMQLPSRIHVPELSNVTHGSGGNIYNRLLSL